MCGFAALISPRIPISDDVLTAVRDRMIHRGPDAGVSWIHENRRLALAHRRLSIIDVSHEADQPMVSADGSLRIVFNGEIYNYVELRSELMAEGVSFRTKSDTEVLLNGFAKWGDEVLNRINGMFAFTIWDERRRQLFVARDRFGEKPLFIGRGQSQVVMLASEMKAILTHPLVRISPAAEAVRRFGGGVWYEDDALTFFDGIERFPPAHAAVFSIDGAELRRWRYWTPNYDNIDDDLSATDAVDKFRELLNHSARLRLRSDVPVGSSLSGGLDSSAVVGLVALERKRGAFTQNTFSACFDDDPSISEGPQIDEMVKHACVRSYRVIPSPDGLMAESQKLHFHQEEPFLSASIYLQWCVARLAQEHGTTVLLDGQGADELLAGYQSWFRLYQLDLLDRGKFVSAARETRLFNRRLRTAARGFPDSGRRFDERAAYSLPELLAVALRRPAVWHGAHEEGLVRPKRGMRLRRVSGETLQYNGLPALLRYADRNSMAFSRETRFPFLDYNLVDFCVRLPDHLLIRDGWQKWILREASGRVIPESIRWRADKVGYAAPLDLWLRGPLKKWAYERVFSTRLRDVEGYDATVLQKLWREHERGLKNNSWAIWRWISLAEWFALIDSGAWKGIRSHHGSAKQSLVSFSQ
jgi:asparagine synthase (glutamine-hydrolysing)